MVLSLLKCLLFKLKCEFMYLLRKNNNGLAMTGVLI